MLAPGDQAPSFELPDETGIRRSSAELLAEGPLVLFFYPAAMTAGCTKESCHFRDLHGEFTAVGARCVGISKDPVDKQQQFSQKHGFPFPLLSDEDNEVAMAFGVARSGILGNKRATFVIDADGRILDVVDSQLRMNQHADRALDTLRARVE